MWHADDAEQRIRTESIVSDLTKVNVDRPTIKSP